MRISGFSMARNADTLYYPMKQAIMSILPIVDEFVVAIGKGDREDRTREIIESIKDNKVKIIDTDWDIVKYPNGMENAHQTDIAKSYCSGDWLFYLQADEVIHEKYLGIIKKRCEELYSNNEVEGLLFYYKHFWGSYNRYITSHAWYPNEIRIIRNDKEIHSWESAQSFRRIPDFDGISYRQQQNTFKLKVARVNAFVYHYGWVRPPEFMQKKRKSLDTIHKGTEKINSSDAYNDLFDYGPLQELTEFKETHPAVMQEWIEKFNWDHQLQYSGKRNKIRPIHKHEKLKYKVLSFIEQKLLNGKQIGGFKNYQLLKGI